MRKRTKIALGVSGLLLAAATATGIAVAKRGEGGGWQGRGGGPGMWRHMRGGRGAFGGRINREMTKAEFDEDTRERFARFDANSDGVIDSAEVGAVMTSRMERRRGRRRGPGGRAARILKRFDRNNDAKVTRAEFEQHVREKFLRLDLNNDGAVTDDDLPPRLRGRAILSRDSANATGHRGGFRWGRRLAHLREADSNNDAAVTLDEAMASAGRIFARFDQNADGAVEKADFKALKNDALDYRVKRFIHRYGVEADQTGSVTRAQFQKLAGERFARRDANADGKIAGDEIGRRGGWWRRWQRGQRRGWRHRGSGGPGVGESRGRQ